MNTSIIIIAIVWYTLGIISYSLFWFLLRNDPRKIPFLVRIALAFGFLGPLCFLIPIALLLTKKWEKEGLRKVI